LPRAEGRTSVSAGLRAGRSCGRAVRVFRTAADDPATCRLTAICRLLASIQDYAPSPGTREVDEPALDVGVHELHAQAIADVEALEALHQFAFGERVRDA